MSKNFLNCFNEEIDVYEGHGETSVKALRNLNRGLRKVEKETDVSLTVTAVTVVFWDEASPYYTATAYCLAPWR